jgi:xylulose-5-phosphate/fructose-6-phosphate phosphoketolase
VRATNEDAELALSYAIEDFEGVLNEAYEIFKAIKKGEKKNPPFIIMKTDKGLTGPEELDGVKIRGNFKAHQIPLLNAKTDEKELKVLEAWLKSYRFNELFDREKGFML